MSLAYLLSTKIGDKATLVGSSTVANSGVENLLDPLPRIRTIFSSGSCYVEGDLGAAYTLDSFFLGYITSLSSSDTFRLRIKNSYPVTSSPLYDSTPLTIWHTGADHSLYKDKHRQLEFTEVTARYFRIDFNCSVAPEVGRYTIGKRVEPAQTVRTWETGGTEPVLSTFDMGNQDGRRSTGGIVRGIKMEWPLVSKVEGLGQIYPLMLERGLTKDFVASMVHGDDTDEADSPLSRLYIGCGALRVVFNSSSQLYSATLEMSELAPLRML